MLDIDYHGFSTEESVSQKTRVTELIPVTFKNCTLLETRIRNITVQYANGKDRYEVFDMQKAVWLVHEIKGTEMM